MDQEPKHRTGKLVNGTGKIIDGIVYLLGLGIIIALGINSCGREHSPQSSTTTNSRRTTSAKAVAETLSVMCKAHAEAWDFEVEQGNQEKHADLAASAEDQYVYSLYDCLSSIDLPEDFKDVLLRHISAHSQYAAHLRNHPSLPRGSSFLDDLEVVLSGMVVSGRLDGGGRAMMSWAEEGKNSKKRIAEP